MDTIYLLVTIDTEEDAWGYENYSCLAESNACPVENIYAIPRVQKIFDEYNIRPVYLCNSPVIADQKAVELLGNLLSQDRCEIGGHIHPWNTPPVSEEINEVNTHMKNLFPALIRQKLTTLTGSLNEAFGIQPKIFRAGRWGMSDVVIRTLKELGYRIDSSVTPYTSWKEQGDGADFTHFPDHPYYLHLARGISTPAEKPGDMLEIPASIGFNRVHFPVCHTVHSTLTRPPWNRTRLISVLHRTGIMQKIWLSPELNCTNEMISLSRVLLRKEINLFNFTFHSTTLLPGKSPFVRTETELDRFLGSIREYFHWLTAAADVVSVTSNELLDYVGSGKIKSCLPENADRQEYTAK